MKSATSTKVYYLSKIKLACAALPNQKNAINILL